MLGTFMAVLDSTIVNVGLPKIMASFGVGIDIHRQQLPYQAPVEHGHLLAARRISRYEPSAGPKPCTEAVTPSAIHTRWRRSVVTATG